ncbi:cation diffusion facilitator family transporter [Ktedonospora formicarum]|uniref:Cation diffusion facilitator transporter n=1 Tax=Ktedonospora formicarum TaxID=2778364 RepID=A0A8J3I531_9CHLR|nr:cation diffusion facilitator family transporter [Ktedonospora formicarum]GHO46312.1 cation diffusion facilitator transporter [Ktedonospora formicarum]
MSDQETSEQQQAHNHADIQPHQHVDTHHAEQGHHHHTSHEHAHRHGILGRMMDAIPFLHGHSHGEVNVDTALETNARGLWALKISLLGLGLTALFQVIIVLISGSVGLLADTIHNFSDAFTAIPLGIAFVLGRKLATRRYTYGFGRVEDLAGVVIVVMIFLSAVLAGYESIIHLLYPEPLRNVWWVMLASVIGFLGNEGVAILRIRVGKEIGSVALVADGHHARVDGLTSLAVLLGALGSLLGFPLADPIIGLLITVAILFIVKDSIVAMWHRLMDAVDPEIIDRLESAAKKTQGVLSVQNVRARWLGHSLAAEAQIVVSEDLSLRESNLLVEKVRHSLFHAQPRLTSVSVQARPDGLSGREAANLTAHHERCTSYSSMQNS